MGGVPRKKKPVSVSKAKKRTWKIFSEWIRRKDADPAGYVQCVCCGKVLHYKESHAGHYIHGNTKRTYFEEKNVHPCCPKCNMYLSGNLTQYALFLEGKYGKGILQELDEKKNGKPWKVPELDAIHDYYKEELKKLDEIRT